MQTVPVKHLKFGAIYFLWERVKSKRKIRIKSKYSFNAFDDKGLIILYRIDGGISHPEKWLARSINDYNKIWGLSYIIE